MTESVQHKMWEVPRSSELSQGRTFLTPRTIIQSHSNPSVGFYVPVARAGGISQRNVGWTRLRHTEPLSRTEVFP
jgi:hypothetical protein